MRAELLVDAQANLGEGPWWDESSGQLYWVDINRPALHVFDAATGRDHSYDVGALVGTVVLGRSGAVYLAVKEGFARFDMVSGTLAYLARPADHPTSNRFNDGKCSPEGRFWAGTMALAGAAGAGALYRLDPDHSCHAILTGVTISNGLVWTADGGTMYYIDSPTRSVVAFPYDQASGALGEPRVVVDTAAVAGVPDGMAIDAEGKLWIAHFGGWAVRRWDPVDGALLAEVAVPAANVTACAFGGPALRTLYITTHGGDKPDKTGEPHAGGLFVVETGVQGTLAHRFADQ